MAALSRPILFPCRILPFLFSPFVASWPRPAKHFQRPVASNQNPYARSARVPTRNRCLIFHVRIPVALKTLSMRFRLFARQCSTVARRTLNVEHARLVLFNGKGDRYRAIAVIDMIRMRVCAMNLVSFWIILMKNILPRKL